MLYIKISLSTAFTVFAFMFDRVYDVKKSLLAQFASRAEYVDITWCALALFIFAFYCKSWEHRKGFQKIEAAFSVLFSVLMLIGRSFFVCNSLKMLTDQKFLTLFAGIGWFVFFYMLLRWVSYFVEKQHLFIEELKSYRQIQNIIFVLLLLCWLPQWIMSLPGHVPADGMWQLCKWFGYNGRPSDHHPWFMAAMFGLLMSIGRYISDNVGVAVIVLFQFLFCAWAYSRVCLVVARYAGRRAAYFTALFFAVVPLWGAYAATVIKDTLAAAIYALYFCSFIEIFEAKETDRKKWLIFGLLNLLVCLSRHEGIYTVLFAGAALFFGLRAERRQLIYVLVGVCICMIGYKIVLFNVVGASKESTFEMLSIPLQQTARYIRDQGEDISEKEKNIIDKVLPYDKLAEIYKPEVSDPVKASIRRHCKSRDLLSYFRVWARMGLRHPVTYLQATINNSYNYYYPFRKCYATYHTGISEKYNKGLNIYYLAREKRNALVRYNESWWAVPGLSLLLSPGAYTWMVLVGLMLLLKRRKYRELIVFTPLIMRIAICCASPVNGLMRYSLPLIACTPLLLAWLAHTLCSVGGDDNG